MRTITKLRSALLLGLLASACSKGFSDADVQKIKGEIRAKYEQEGCTVMEVSMIRESDTRLHGFAKVEKKILGLPVSAMKDCTATMDVHGGEYLWECK